MSGDYRTLSAGSGEARTTRQKLNSAISTETIARGFGVGADCRRKLLVGRCKWEASAVSQDGQETKGEGLRPDKWLIILRRLARIQVCGGVPRSDCLADKVRGMIAWLTFDTFELSYS